MKALYAQSLTDEERQILRQSLKASNGFTVRRAQMLLLSADERLKVEAAGGVFLSHSVKYVYHATPLIPRDIRRISRGKTK